MAATIVCTTLVRNSDGSFVLSTADGSGFSFASIDEMKNEIAEMDGNPRSAALALLANWLGKEPAGDNPSANVDGKACTFDLKGNPPVWVR